MKVADFLIARPANYGKSQPFIIGETGFSFDDSVRPASIMDAWLSGEGVPVAARDVLSQNPQFTEIVGLIGVPTGSPAQRRPSSGWILARASSGLISISIRDARNCDSSRLLHDAEFATDEAERFAANFAIVLVQAANGTEADNERKMLAAESGTEIPELNRLCRSLQRAR